MEGWPKLTKITIYNKYFAKIIQMLGPALLLDFIVLFFLNLILVLQTGR